VLSVAICRRERYSSSGLRPHRTRHEEHQDGVGIDFDIRARPRTLFVSRPLAPGPIDLDEMTLPGVVAWQPLNIRKPHDQSRLADHRLPSLEPTQSVCKVALIALASLLRLALQFRYPRLDALDRDGLRRFPCVGTNQ
jgi:hypothetical protein